MDPFPQQISEAARAFPRTSAAYAQLQDGKNYIGLHVLAPEIMKQFVGGIRFENDPRGTLFYKSFSNVTRAYFTVFYYNGPETWKTVRVDFYALQTHSLEPFARFLARVDIRKYKLPLLRPGFGNGKWQQFVAGESQTSVIRVEDSNTLNLYFPPIRREVVFHTNQTSEIDATGILIFPDMEKLKDQPDKEELHDDRPLLADYSPDRIVFRLKRKGKEELKVYGIFVPSEPLQGIGASGLNPPATTWNDFESEAKN